ncbi:MAG: DUF692 domain-containing protein [Proteobacteria bacterium]|nr:DUF692 domain-containing protein [Pseudomonadota bacterium]
MSVNHLKFSGAGLGLRRALISPFHSYGDLSPVSFMEVAPENWITVGGKSKRVFREFAEKYPMILHGLSLSIGGPDELNETFVKAVKKLKKEINSPIYSEHLSYCSDGGQLYDLMPIPFTEAAANHVVDRILRVQDIMGERIAMENVSYYLSHPGAEMSEIDFLKYVIEKSDCLLHLDVNNIYVNSINHKYDAYDFLKQVPAEKIAYIHIAGHFDEAEDLRIDTHGSPIIEHVWSILEKTYEWYGVFPTLLERDFNFPPVSELISEVSRIEKIQNKYNKLHQQHSA